MPAWRVILAITIYVAILFYTVQIQTAPALAALGLRNPAEIGFLTSLASLSVPIGTLVYSRGSWLPAAWLLAVESLLMGRGFFLMSHESASTPFLVGCAIDQLGAGMILPTLQVGPTAGSTQNAACQQFDRRLNDNPKLVLHAPVACAGCGAGRSVRAGAGSQGTGSRAWPGNSNTGYRSTAIPRTSAAS